MFISLYSLFLAAYISTIAAAPLDTRSLAGNELEVRDPTKKSPSKTCPVKKTPGKKRSIDLPRRSVLEDVIRLFRRDPGVFIGWHGTNKETADFWAAKGHIEKPPNNAGRSGLDAELGPGLYITDTLSTAVSAANTNSDYNTKVKKIAREKVAPKACAIYYAGDLPAWKKVPKVEMPESIRGNGPAKAAWRAQYINEVFLFAGPSISVGPLDTGVHQMMIPESFNPMLKAVCYDVVGTDSPAATSAGITQVSYNAPSVKVAWNIFLAKDGVAQDIKDAPTDCIMS